MNPKIAITVDAKNKAISSLTGMVTVGAKVDVDISGIASTDVPNWGPNDDFTGYSLRFRVVDECGNDLVRYQLHKKTETNPDVWSWDSVNGKFTATNVDFDTDRLRAAFRGVSYSDYVEFGVILDSIVDRAQYAVGRIKIRQWASASTEDPTVLPDWRETVAKLTTDLAAVEASKTAAAASATSASQSASLASQSASSASQSANSALNHENNAVAAKNLAQTAANTASDAVTKYPRISAVNGNWERYVNGAWEDTGVHAKGDKGDSGASSWNDITDKPSSIVNIDTLLAAKAMKPTTGSLGDDSSLDDVIAKINTLISELKGL